MEGRGEDGGGVWGDGGVDGGGEDGGHGMSENTGRKNCVFWPIHVCQFR